MKEKFTLFEIVETTKDDIVVLKTLQSFYNDQDAHVYLRSNKDLKNGEYVILKVYKKENGRLSEK